MKKYLFSSILLFCLLFILLSCGKVSENPIVSYKTVSAEQLKDIILTNYSDYVIFPRIILSDSSYILPTEEWINKELKVELGKFQFDYNIVGYRENSNDCDKYSLYGRAVANILNNHNKNNNSSGIAVGEFRYFRNSINAHSINCIITCDKEGKVKLVYFEPQLLKVIEASKESFPLLFIF